MKMMMRSLYGTLAN